MNRTIESCLKVADELAERQAAASPGPWERDAGGSLGHIKSMAEHPRQWTPTVLRYSRDNYDKDVVAVSVPDAARAANAELVCHARSTEAPEVIRWLAAEVQRLENPSPGDTEAQAGAWVAVWKALEKIGLLSFIGSFSVGRVRAVEFIEHIGVENAALRVEVQRLQAIEVEVVAMRESLRLAEHDEQSLRTRLAAAEEACRKVAAVCGHVQDCVASDWVLAVRAVIAEADEKGETTDASN